MSVLGKSPPSSGGTAAELTEAKAAAGNQRRTTSSSRHRYKIRNLSIFVSGKQVFEAKEPLNAYLLFFINDMKKEAKNQTIY